MSTVKDKEETKIIWSKKEKDSSKETYGCEIVVENGKPSDVRTTDAPTDCFIVTYEFNEETHQDLTRGSRVNVFDCLLYTSPSPRDKRQSRMPSSA